MHRKTTLFIALLASLSTLPAASQQGKKPPTNLYIDVLTHNMAGMPDMGGMMGGMLGGMMARRMGGADASRPVYPTTRTGGMSGQYLDMALHNALKPGVQADDDIPDGLRLGRSLTLVPIGRDAASPERPSRDRQEPGQVPDVEITIREYWGCGAEVRPGQPKVTTIKVRGGSFDPRQGPAGMRNIGVQMTGSVSRNLSVPDHDIDLKPGYVYWPNREFGHRVPDGASIAGEHRITGDGIPASMRFQVRDSADFMPKLALRTQGEPTAAVYVGWAPVAHAQAYFLSGMHMNMKSEKSYEMTLWSSAEIPGAGGELHTYLPDSYVTKWLKQKVLLAPTATSCVIPRGIFASPGGAQGGMMPGMLMATAYGPESWITYPPKPADSRKPWNPEWSVRLRARSTATAILGLNFGGDEGPQRGNEPQRPQRRPGMGDVLRGILGG